MEEQLDLFAQARLPPDVIKSCSRCGKQIVVQHFTGDAEGTVESEFIGRGGECFKCERPRRRKEAK